MAIFCHLLIEMAYQILKDQSLNFLGMNPVLGGGMMAAGAAGLAGLGSYLSSELKKTYDKEVSSQNKPILELKPNNPPAETVPEEVPVPKQEATLDTSITQTPERDHVLTNMDGVTAEGEIQKPNEPLVQLPQYEVPDTTGENEEMAIDNTDYLDFLLQMRNEQWAREDKIREQARYDQQHAYRYAVDDMIKAGINPNLINISPAQSGGGITQATGLNTSLLEKQIDQQTQEIITLIQQGWKGDENDKDRITNSVISGITSILQTAGQIGMAIILGKSKKK